MNNSHFNLARVWRSKTFDEIIGQELAIRLVKNSLFKNQLFPVYLIAGQRGCGKTTLGRVFAAAINCVQRENFSINPREVSLPCLQCESCQAMRNGEHPDFFEIDAASHTGVDNIRSLIEGASLLPGLGQKKIYLIDEAHMLSKAAFNAFLKILEEPPTSVLFMLATTDPHKVLDTVRSRCFQLFLSPVDPLTLAAYLEHICQQEEIVCEKAALLLIAHESEGSVRDALNILERLRIGYGAITSDQVTNVIGTIGYDQLLKLCDLAFSHATEELIRTLEELSLKRFAPLQLWKKMLDILRALLWMTAGKQSELLSLYAAEVEALAQKITAKQLVGVMELWYEHEPLFVKTNAQHALIEMLFIRMSQSSTLGSSINRAPTIGQSTSGHPTRAAMDGGSMGSASMSSGDDLKKLNKPMPIDQPTFAKSKETVTSAKGNITQSAPATSPWNSFVADLVLTRDPLVLSIFKQGIFKAQSEKEIHIVFAEHLSFFKELIEQTQQTWQPLFHKHFGSSPVLRAEFAPAKTYSSGSVLAPVHSRPISSSAPQAQEKTASMPNSSYMPVRMSEQVPTVTRKQQLELKDPERFKKVRALLTLFPGTVVEEKESAHE